MRPYGVADVAPHPPLTRSPFPPSFRMGGRLYEGRETPHPPLTRSPFPPSFRMGGRLYEGRETPHPSRLRRDTFPSRGRLTRDAAAWGQAALRRLIQGAGGSRYVLARLWRAESPLRFAPSPPNAPAAHQRGHAGGEAHYRRLRRTRRQPKRAISNMTAIFSANAAQRGKPPWVLAETNSRKCSLDKDCATER